MLPENKGTETGVLWRRLVEMGLCGWVGSLQAFMHRRASQECKAGSEGAVWALEQSVC